MTQTRMNVLIAVVLGVFALSALSMVVAFGVAMRPSKPAYRGIDHAARSRELAWAQNAKLLLIQNGTITKIDCPNHEVQANGSSWAMVPLDSKKVAVETLSRICKAETTFERIALIDNRSGRPLAEYSIWSGVTLH